MAIDTWNSLPYISYLPEKRPMNAQTPSLLIFYSRIIFTVKWARSWSSENDFSDIAPIVTDTFSFSIIQVDCCFFGHFILGTISFCKFLVMVNLLTFDDLIFQVNGMSSFHLWSFISEFQLHKWLSCLHVC